MPSILEVTAIATTTAINAADNPTAQNRSALFITYLLKNCINVFCYIVNQPHSGRRFLIPRGTVKVARYASYCCRLNGIRSIVNVVVRDPALSRIEDHTWLVAVRRSPQMNVLRLTRRLQVPPQPPTTKVSKVARKAAVEVYLMPRF